MQDQGNALVIGLAILMITMLVVGAIGTFEEKWWAMRYLFIQLGLIIGIPFLEALRSIAVFSSQSAMQTVMETVQIVWNAATLLSLLIFVVIIFIKNAEYLTALMSWFGKRRNK
jgi:hypothetical protein